MKHTTTLFTLLFIFLLSALCSCRKIISCNADICNSKRKKLETVTNQKGIMGISINNNDRRWMINVFDEYGLSAVKSCIICGDIPDSLKQMNKQVVFSGELKDACGYYDNTENNKYFIVTPTLIR
jgi:hypothetical protein